MFKTLNAWKNFITSYSSSNLLSNHHWTFSTFYSNESSTIHKSEKDYW